MREIIKDYLYQPESFVLFSSAHIIGLVVFLALWIWLPNFAKEKLSINEQESFGRWLSYIIAFQYIAWVMLEIIAGTFDVKLHLPFHLCRFANLALPFVMIYKNQLWFEIIFFFGLSGMFQASITPDIIHGFPHFHFIRFFIGHSGQVLAILYLVFVIGLKPRAKGIWISMIGLNIFLFIAFLANTILDSNYFWIRSKPPVPSLLDYLGDWPWYLVWAEGIALLHFLVVYSPFYFMKKRQSNGKN